MSALKWLLLGLCVVLVILPLLSRRSDDSQNETKGSPR